jgi:DNA-binding SARP family transcriptional activator
MLELRLLGGLDLKGSDGQSLLSVLSHPKRVAVLSYLALSPPLGFVTRDKLLAIFWPESDESRGRNALSQILHGLRRSLGEEAILSRSVNEVGLNGEVLRCDVLAFEEAVLSGDHERALELYEGDLLDGFHLDGGIQFDEWVEGERVRLREMAAVSAWAVAHELIKKERLTEAERTAQRAMALVCTDENEVRRFIGALAEGGDRAAAVQFFERFCQKLKAKLELEPSSETRRAVDSIRTSDEDRVAATAVSRAPAKEGPDRSRSKPDVEHLGTDVPSNREPPSNPRLARVLAALLLVAAIPLLVVAVLWWTGFWAEDTPIRRVVVLPPDSTGDEVQDAFLLDFHRNLISNINRRTALDVPSQASALTFRRVAMTLPEFAQVLDVDAVVEIHGEKQADSVWIEVGFFVASPTEKHLWDSAFSAHAADQRLLARRIALRLGEETGTLFSGEDWNWPERTRRVNPDALAAYQLASANLEQRSLPSLNRAVHLFSRSIQLDPTFAPAYAGQSIAYCVQAINTYRPSREVADSAGLRAAQALALDSILAEGYTALGCHRYRLEWDMEGAEEAFRRALELDDLHFPTYLFFTQFLQSTGREQEALAVARRGVEVAPLAVLPQSNLSRALATAGQKEEAIRIREEILEFWPDWPQDPMSLINTYLAAGGVEEALSIYRSHQKHFDDLPRGTQWASNVAWNALFLGQAGHQEEASEILGELLEHRAAGVPVTAIAIAWAHVGLGQTDEALDWLERAHAEGEHGLVYLNMWVFEDLRGTPRFEKIRRDVFGEFVVGAPVEVPPEVIGGRDERRASQDFPT